MIKKSKIIYVVGSAIIGIAALLIVFFTLIGSGVVDVNQKTIAFASSSEVFVYDGTEHTNDGWEIINGQLKEGHTAKVEVSGSQTDVGTTTNYMTVTIVDASGADVSENYEIEYQPGTLTVVQADLTIVAESATREYDGTPLTDENYSIIGELAQGQSLDVEVTGEITNVGSTANTARAKIVDGDGVDKTSNYNLSFVDGKLTVTARKLSISSEGGEKIYDGDYFINEKYSITEGSVAPNQNCQITFTSGLKDVGSTENKFSVTIFNDKDNDITSNYDISSTYGTLTITPATISVSSATNTKVYDGTALKDANYEYEGTIASGQNLNVEVTGEITDVGSTTNTLKVSVVDDDDIDRTYNYTITLKEGKLTVTKRKISITSADGSKVYDGKAFGSEKYELTSGTLVEGHSIKVTSSSTMKNVGTGENKITISVFDANSENVTDNYNIAYVYGTLTITKAPLEVSTGSDTKFYDGTPLTNDEWDYTKDNLAEGQSIDITVTGSQTLAGESNNTARIRVYDQDEVDTTDNYTITLNPGHLVVKKMPIQVTTASASKDYDGTPLTCDSSEYSTDQIADGQNMQVVVTGSQTDAGQSDNTAKVTITGDDGTDYSENYAITLYEGTLTVRKLPITIITSSSAKMYDGTPLVCNSWHATTESVLVNGDAIDSVVLPCSRTDIGTTKNEASSITILHGDKNVTNNYEVTYIVGDLTVMPATLTVRSKDASKEYDGKPLVCKEWDIVSISALPENFTVTVAVSGTITEIGQTANTIAEVIVADADGNNVTFNYTVTCELGTLTVKSKGSSETGSGSSSNGDLDTSGNLGGDSDDADDESVVLRLYSDTDNQAVYLRFFNYGDFDGQHWAYAQDYTDLLDGTYSLNYLASANLKNLGYTSTAIQVEVAGSYYYLPYYMDMTVNGGYDIQTSDVAYYGNSNKYSLNYYSFNYVTNGPITITDPAYAEQEALYRAYVYENYTYVPSSTISLLDNIISAQNFNKNNSDIISAVASYIQNSAVYNKYYNTAVNSEDDVVVAFLTKYKEGVCRHYATSATMLFRRLGFPARYCMGYLGNTKAGEWTDITSAKAHAWVEVYLDGFGWVQVEVTGFSTDSVDDGTGTGNGSGGTGDTNGGNGGAGGAGDSTQYTFKPIDEYMKYNGIDTLTQSQTLQGFAELSKLGYTYQVTVEGSRKIPGISESTITSLTIYDKDGNDVTSKINYTLETGKLQVYAAEINIVTKGATKVYDGKALICSDYTCDDLMVGHSFEYFNVVGTVTNVGKVLNKVELKIIDENGNDVTDYYKINRTYGTLEVTPRSLTITSSSASKAYDGTELVCGEYSLGEGQALAEGDRIVVSITGKQVSMGHSENAINSVTIIDENGVDVTSNYNIITINGTLTVTYK